MNPETGPSHPACRSLMQKAVRRGQVGLALKLAAHLEAEGHGDWVRARAGVIAFEECWEAAAALDLRSMEGAAALLASTASSVKDRDAAGLGTLALAYSEGRDVLDGTPGDRDIKVVASGISRPNDFWQWAESQGTPFPARAHKAFSKASWPWDKAFTVAGAYLAATYGVPGVTPSQGAVSCPPWVALDKHVPEGRALLGKVARQLGCSPEALGHSAFYCEGALVDDDRGSPWFSRATAWKLSSLGLSLRDSNALWTRARPAFMDASAAQAYALQEHVAHLPEAEFGNEPQLNLL